MGVHDNMSAVPANAENGQAFYAHLFTSAPAIRAFFKGAENYSADDVKKDPRFGILGSGFIKELGEMTALSGGDLDAKIKALVVRHTEKSRGVTSDLWAAIIPIWVAFLSTKTTLDDAHKKAWDDWGKHFAATAKAAN